MNPKPETEAEIRQFTSRADIYPRATEINAHLCSLGLTGAEFKTLARRLCRKSSEAYTQEVDLNYDERMIESGQKTVLNLDRTHIDYHREMGKQFCSFIRTELKDEPIHRLIECINKPVAKVTENTSSRQLTEDEKACKGLNPLTFYIISLVFHEQLPETTFKALADGVKNPSLWKRKIL